MTHHAHWRDVSPGHFASKHTDTDTDISLETDDGQRKKEKKRMGKCVKVFKNHRYCWLCSENWFHMCVCSLFQVIQHISTALCVYMS